MTEEHEEPWKFVTESIVTTFEKIGEPINESQRLALSGALAIWLDHVAIEATAQQAETIRQQQERILEIDGIAYRAANEIIRLTRELEQANENLRIERIAREGMHEHREEFATQLEGLREAARYWQDRAGQFSAEREQESATVAMLREALDNCGASDYMGEVRDIVAIMLEKFPSDWLAKHDAEVRDKALEDVCSTLELALSERQRGIVRKLKGQS